MKLIPKTIFFFAALLASGAAMAQSMNMTGTVLAQPCNNNGSIGVTVTGLTPPINYTYTNWMANVTIVNANVNSTSNSATGLGAYQAPWGNANVWVITASDGTNTANLTMVLTPPFTFSTSLSVASCPALSTVQATFSGGTAPYSCLWTNVSNSLTYNTNPAAVPNGIYSLAVTDANNCIVTTAADSSDIYVYTTSNIQAGITGNPANCTNGTATVMATGGVPPYTYLWSNSATTQNISGLSQGPVQCTVTDALGCQTIAYYYVQQAVTINFNSTITNATCLQNNGAITGFVSGGTAPYTYAWSNGGNTLNLTNLAGGVQYIVQITDAAGCTKTGYAYVNVTTPISVTYSATASSCTAATGGATVTPTGGTGPYTVLWTIFPSNVTGSSISNRPSGTYAFKVTDANGCIKTGSAFIPPASTINAFMNNVSVICPATTGNIGVTVSGSNPPFTYLWNTGATTANITGTSLGSKSCVITDALGCSVTKYGSLNQVSNVNVSFNTTPAGCIFTANGSITASASGGTSPYTYAWSNGQTGNTATGLLTGNYYVTVTSANGCTNNYNNSMAFVGYNAGNNSCYCTITGTVYADANNNCVRNSGENGIPNIQVHCSGMGYAYTNANGVYSFMVPTGSYTISETVQQIYPLSPCQANNQVVSVTSASNCVSLVNFANNVIILHDLHIINTNITPAIPGNVYTQKVIVQNDGTAIENGIQFGYTHDGQLNYSTCAPWTLAQPNAINFPNWYRITTGFPTINPAGNSFALINYNVPTNIPLNTIVNFHDTVSWNTPMTTSWLTDNTPWNNVKNHQAFVIGSWDPNYKEVSPKGTGTQGNIQHKDSVLTYVVHFQNEGTYFAENVVVTDTLDANLNIQSLRPGYGDHDYTVTMNENGVAKFTFKNIHLPWKSGYGDVLSSGMFSYSIKLKSNLPLGTQIKNKAAIYFDYNEPVITNQTLNTLAATATAIDELSVHPDNVFLFPNPASNYFTLSVKSNKTESGLLRIFDISGREVSVKNIELQTGDNYINENTSQLQNGIYIVR
ncbi:MAG: T9SS type A sorting domain-containing protein, partial [Bacteroidota bacterium]